ncbi:hypothetical protein ACU8L2_23405 [Rhizobium leguminosarum]
MTKAKNLYGQNKTDFVKTSFQNKIDYMKALRDRWKKSGRRGNEYWPDTLESLKGWDDPEGGFHKWKSNSITRESSLKYGDLVKEFWKLQEEIAAIPSDGEDGPEIRRLKRENVRLATQVSAMIYEIMDYRDEIIRMDPANSFLKATPFPPAIPQAD